jgi:tight adherence protein C
MSPDVLIALGGVFVAVALVSGALVIFAFNRTAPERRRIDQLLNRPGGAAVAGVTPTGATGLLSNARTSREQRLARWVPKSPKDVGRLQRRLAQAGYHRFEATVAFAIAEIAVPLLFALTTLWVMGLRGGWLFAALAGAVGYLLPGVVLGRMIKAEKKRIQNGLPDALDLIIVCVEAGMGLDQAILKASEELQVSHPALAQELRLINIEIRAGKSRMEAFKNFADRTKVDDVKSLVAMLVQTDRFGTSISQALRTHAEVSRTKRRQRAEEKAAKLGVKLVFPLVLCLFPALYAVTLGPAVIQFVRVFFGQVMQR